jgi:ATP-binding cassette subfamily B protein
MGREGSRYVAENMRLAKTIGVFSPLMTAFTTLGLAIVIWLGGRLTILGYITTGDFVAFISYLNLLTWPMMAIGWVTNLIQRGSASMRRINRVLDELPEIKDEFPAKQAFRIQGKITFNNVSLSYQGSAAKAVKEISLTIGAGQTVAFAGRVGSGKTSLLHLIPRLYDAPRGSVLIDDVDIHDIPLRVLRKSIGFVTQEVIIFSDTIRSNLLLGRKGISTQTLEKALRTAQIHEEVMALENGMDTVLGERGITLSGGQRQRLSIARAVIADPPILILDDALSMVDTRTEERILNQILASREGKTNLIVSHRLSTISRADMIVVMDQGEVVEVGSHQSLLKISREYARLYEKQLLAQELEMTNN